MTDCPCGTGEPYETCCARFHRGEAPPPTAEALMRARYSAFAMGDDAFLRDTWDGASAGPLIDPALTWTGLHVTGRTGGGLLEATGTVEFTARYRRDGVPGRLRENSRFARRDGRWCYLGPV
ncbi:MAG TPA: YchJ family metal-binding protein [Jatrophihabitans sp.]|nr:YchJ family metal-binding protein [Jatrophihabitans sp.]